jgi:hypothetical protein
MVETLMMLPPSPIAEAAVTKGFKLLRATETSAGTSSNDDGPNYLARST